MKSQERHELKSNELADWFANVPEWIKENRSTVIYTVIIGVLILVSVYLKWLAPKPAVSREQAEMSQAIAGMEMAKLQVVTAKPESPVRPDAFRSITEKLGTLSTQISDKDSEALALVKQGEALRAELHYLNIDPQSRPSQLEKARKAYTEAINKAGNDTQTLVMAKFGLGLTEEEAGNYEQASKIYTEIVGNDQFAGSVIRQMANQRVQSMDDYKGNFVFVELPKPAEAAKPVVPAPAPVAPQAAPAPAPKAPEANNSPKQK